MNGNHRRPDGLRLDFVKDADDESLLVFLDCDAPGDGVCIGVGDDPVAACNDAINAIGEALRKLYGARQAFLKGDAA